MLSNISQWPQIDTAIGIFICNKLIPTNTDDRLTVISQIIMTELLLKCQYTPSTIETAPVPCNYKDSSLLSFGSNHFIIIEFIQEKYKNCVISSDNKHDQFVSLIFLKM